MLHYFLYRLAHLFVIRLPLRVSYWVADRVADLHFLLSLKSRREVFKKLLWAGDGKPLRIHEVRKVFQNFGRQLVDFLRLSRLDREEFLRQVQVEGFNHLKKAFGKGKGVIAVSAHFGNWEWGGAGLALLGYPVHALVLSHRDPRINQFFVNQRTGRGVHVIPMTDSVWKIVHPLSQKEILLLLADRETSENGIPVSFLGKKVYFPRGPAALSRRCGSPLLVCFFVREREGRFRFFFEPPIEPEKTKNMISDLERMTQKVAVLLERTIRRYPSQWFPFQGPREFS